MDPLARRGPGPDVAWESSVAVAWSVSDLVLHTVQQGIAAAELLLSLQDRTADHAVEHTFPVLFGKDRVKRDLVRDQGRRNAAMLGVIVQVKLPPVSPYQMVVDHTVAVVAVDLVTGTVIVIETAHYQRSECCVSKEPSI